MRFKLINDVGIFKHKSIDLTPNKVTVLFGRNGGGKTTLLKDLERGNQSKKDVRVIAYDNLRDGGDKATMKRSFLEEFTKIAENFLNSEGQSIIYNLGDLMEIISEELRFGKSKKVLVLIDGIDSGLDITNIELVKESMHHILDNKDKVANRKVDVYLVLSSNTFTLAKREEAVYIRDFSKHYFTKYENWEKYIRRTD